MAITFCTTPASLDHAREVELVNEQINAATTPEQFNQLMADHLDNNPSYLTSGGGRFGETVLLRAIKVGNQPLVDHIVRIGGTRLLEVSTYLTRETPLVAAVKSNAAEAERYAMVARLIQLGAPVNQAGRDGPFGATPLEAAITTGRRPLIRLLLINGATRVDGPIEGMPPELAAPAPAGPLDWPEKIEGIAYTYQVQYEIEEINRARKEVVLAELPHMPRELCAMIADYAAGHPEALN